MEANHRETRTQAWHQKQPSKTQTIHRGKHHPNLDWKIWWKGGPQGPPETREAMKGVTKWENKERKGDETIRKLWIHPRFMKESIEVKSSKIDLKNQDEQRLSVASQQQER